MAYDDVIVYIGEFGRYQCRIYFMLFLTAISYAFHFMVGVFLEAETKFRCLLPFENPENASYQLPSTLMDVAYPWDNETKSWSQCQRYDHNWTDRFYHTAQNFSSTDRTVICHSFAYDKTTYELTTTTEFNQVCHNKWLKATTGALFMVGVMLGAIIFGGLADKYGRKPIFCLIMVVNLVAGLVTAASPETISYMISRLIVGMSTSALFIIAFVAALEMAHPKRRTQIGVCMQLYFTLGYILTSGFAYFIRNWRILQIAVTLPSLACLGYCWLIPESVRWLLSKGRLREAKDLILKAASANGVEVSEDTLDSMLSDKGAGLQPETEESFFDLFRYPNLRRRTLVLFLSWFVNSATYFGLSWNTPNLGGNDYLNSAIAGLVEIPGTAILFFTLNRWGRRIVLCGSMILAGVSLVLIIIVPADLQWLVVLLAMIGKSAITTSYVTVSIFSAEQYPTVIRNVGVGACSTCASVGGILAPYILHLSSVWTPLPYVVFGSGSLIAGLSALLLPETLNQKLPETIQDGEEFGMSVKYEYVQFRLTQKSDLRTSQVTHGTQSGCLSSV